MRNESGEVDSLKLQSMKEGDGEEVGSNHLASPEASSDDANKSEPEIVTMHVQYCVG